MASAPPRQGGLKMFDINEIRKRAQQASEHATDSMKKTVEKSEELISKIDRKSTRLNSSHASKSRMPSSA